MNTQPYRPVTYMIGSTTTSGNMPMSPMGQMSPMSHMSHMGTPGAMGTMGTMGTTGTTPPPVTSGSPMTPTGTVIPTTAPVFEQSYIENIFRLNLGKIGTFYFTYENNTEWNAKVYKGVLEAAGRDHIIISDPNTGQRVVLLMVNFDYATFEEPLTYQYPGVIGNPPTRSWR